jgi:hypothetical protein
MSASTLEVKKSGQMSNYGLSCTCLPFRDAQIACSVVGKDNYFRAAICEGETS